MQNYFLLNGFIDRPSPRLGPLNLKSSLQEHDSLTVRALASHAADPGSNPAGGNDFFN